MCRFIPALSVTRFVTYTSIQHGANEIDVCFGGK
jgi:hypothetical protein